MNPTIVLYRAVKFNKCDTQYKSTISIPSNHWITERVKIEAFQGYSKAYNLAEYFRTRGATSWKGGECISGLWKSERPGVYYGDRKSSKGKSLILFFRSKDHEQLKVVSFPDGYYPSKSMIVQLINQYK